MSKLYDCQYCMNEEKLEYMNMTRKEYFKHSKTEFHITKKNNCIVLEKTKQYLNNMDKLKSKMNNKNYYYCKESNFNKLLDLEKENKIILSEKDLNK